MKVSLAMQMIALADSACEYKELYRAWFLRQVLEGSRSVVVVSGPRSVIRSSLDIVEVITPEA